MNPRFPSLIAIALLGATTSAFAQDRITIAGSEWCPYNCALESPSGLGYMVDIAKAVFEPDVKVDYTLVNWARAIEEVKAGRLTALVGSSKRDGFIFTKEPLGIAQNGFAIRANDTFEFKGVESLKGKVLGAINGYSYTEELDAYIAANSAQADAVQLTSGELALTNNLRKLAANRVDLVVDDVNVLRQQIGALGLGNAVKVVAGGPPDAVYIAFGETVPQAQAYADRLDQGLAKLRASGQLAKILDHYQLTDWKK